MPGNSWVDEHNIEAYEIFKRMDICAGYTTMAFEHYRKKRKKILALKHNKNKRRGRHAKRKDKNV